MDEANRATRLPVLRRSRRVFIGALVVATCGTLPQHSVSATSDSGPQFVGETCGCGNIEVLRFSSDHKWALIIRASRSALAISTQPKTFSLPVGLSLLVGAFSSEHPLRTCGDVFGPHQVEAGLEWEAVSGEITVRTSSDSVRPGDDYQVSASIRNLVLKEQFGDRRVEVPSIQIPWVTVGIRQRDPDRR